jgi:hypothetical protein
LTVVMLMKRGKHFLVLTSDSIVFARSYFTFNVCHLR